MVGLENIPYLQPKQLPNAVVQDLAHALNGVQIRLVSIDDSESDMSDMDTSHLFLPQGYCSTNPLGLGLGGPSDLEEGEISDHSPPTEPMDQAQADTLGHGVYSAGGAVSDASAAPSRISDF